MTTKISSRLRQLAAWYVRRETALRLVFVQLAITAVCLLVAGLNYPGYDITQRTISGLGNHAESPAWPFFTFQTLTAWFCLWPLFIHAFMVLFREIQQVNVPPSIGQSTRATSGKGKRVILQVLLGLGLLTFLLAWVGYAIVGTLDDSAPTLLVHRVGALIAFGGLAAGSILWLFPIIAVKRFRKYPVAVALCILIMVAVAVSLMYGGLPAAWYTGFSFWQWMAFFGINLWIWSLGSAVWQY